MCCHKQLPLPGRQHQQPSLSCIWEILNAGKRVSKLSFKIFAAASYLLYMSVKRTWMWKQAQTLGRDNQGASQKFGRAIARVEINPFFFKKPIPPVFCFFSKTRFFGFLKRKKISFFFQRKQKNPILNCFCSIMQYHYFQNYIIITSKH